MLEWLFATKNFRFLYWNILRFYFFGCLEVNSDGEFSFSAAPEGTFFEGNINPRVAGSRAEKKDKKQERLEGRDYTDEWIAMMNQYCNIILTTTPGYINLSKMSHFL